MKKILLTKSSTVGDSSSPTYLIRKSMVKDYQELFQALLRLPDKKVQARVLDAINSAEKNSPQVEAIEICRKCKQKTPKMIDASTQTDKMSSLSTNATNSDDSQDTQTQITTVSMSTATTATTTVTTTATTTNNNDGNIKKRKRRRKIQLPQVMKRSQALQQIEHNKPILQKRKANMTKESISKHQDLTRLNNKRPRSDSTHSSISSICSNSAFLFEQVENCQNATDNINMQMADECLKAKIIQNDGLLPIHSAIVDNDVKYLQRQIMVWKHIYYTDLNELITNDDEDCLQLAIKENSPSEIINILLLNNINPNSSDDKSNTIIHLAILNEIDIESMRLLMEKFDLKLLSTRNYDGLTPLHLAVRQNNYILAEELLNMLDKRLLNCKHFQRNESNVNNSKTAEKKFSKYYEEFCVQSKLEAYMRKYNKDDLCIKRRLMDAVEIRSGKTALFYAIENKMEHFIYFLLAHLTDPRVENLSGQDATAYLTEFSKSFNLTLKIDQIMEYIINLLEK